MRGVLAAPGLALALALAGSPARAEDRPPVRAEQGVGIGGNVINSTINNTVNQENPETLKLLAKTLADKDASEEKRREAEVKVAELAAKFGFTSTAVTELFKILGEQNVPEVPARLIEIGTQFAATRDQLAALEPDDPHAAELAGQAKDALDKGSLADADALLNQAKESEAAAFREARKLKQRAQEAEDRHALNLAKMEASQGDIALTRLRYLDAAQRFAEAAAKVPQGHEDERWKYLNTEADALYRQGYEFGDNVAAGSAIERYRHLAELRPRNAFPRDWARTQANLGIALARLGERESGTARLEEAVAAFREVLQENTRERVPLEWAKAQICLGAALETLGERESGTARLEEAVAAFREALKELTRARVPLQWAMTQVNLGNALAVLGERESGTVRLEEAVAAYREALQESTRARVPLQWATTQMNLALVYRDLFDKDHQPRHLGDALKAADGALEEFRKAKAAFYIDKAERQRGEILAMKGKAVSRR